MKLLLIGARHDGQAALVLDLVAEASEHEIVAFLDDDAELWNTAVHGVPVLGPPTEILRAIALGAEAGVVSIGNPRARERLGAVIVESGLALPSLIHPRAYVAPSARLGRGAFVGALAIVSTAAVVDELAMIAPGAMLSHHVRMGRCATVAPRVVLGGRARVGDRVFLGLGAMVLPDRSVGDDAVVGAGSLVNRDVPALAHVVGMPARQVRV